MGKNEGRSAKEHQRSSLGKNAALVTSALPLGFLGFKVLTGDTDISVSPQLGVNLDPHTGHFKPSIQANLQFGRGGPLNPTLSVGSQFDPGSGGVPLSPTLGSGVNTGDASHGIPTANVGSNVAVGAQGTKPQFGTGASFGAVSLGNPINAAVDVIFG